MTHYIDTLHLHILLIHSPIPQTNNYPVSTLFVSGTGLDHLQQQYYQKNIYLKVPGKTAEY